MSEYTTIRKKIKEYNVLITNDPKECERCNNDHIIKNFLVVWCIHENNWCSFVISKEFLKEPESVIEDYLYRTIAYKFKKP